MTETIAELKFRLMQADTLIELLDEEIKLLAERIEYANAGPLVTIPRELVFAMEAKMKEQAAEIERLAAQCKHALDDDDLDAAMCKCGHELSQHVHGECMTMLSHDYICDCDNFEEAE